jgi:hypothetical protein
MKFNCILGLCVNGCLLLGATGCMECAAKAAEAVEALAHGIWSVGAKRDEAGVLGVIPKPRFMWQFIAWIWFTLLFWCRDFFVCLQNKDKNISVA